MEKLKDELEENAQSYLSLNFLMADYQGKMGKAESQFESKTEGDLSNFSWQASEEADELSDEKEIYYCSNYHKHISRTFDIGIARKI